MHISVENINNLLISFQNTVLEGMQHPLKSKGVTVQLTNSDITQTLNRHAYFVRQKCKRLMHESQGYLKLAGWSNTTWIRRGMPERKQKAKFSNLRTP